MKSQQEQLLLTEQFVSCFDKDGSEDEKSNGFWKKVVDKSEIDTINALPKLHEGSLYRSKIETDKQVHFILKPGLLIYKPDSRSPTISGVMKLTFQRIESF